MERRQSWPIPELICRARGQPPQISDRIAVKPNKYVKNLKSETSRVKLISYLRLYYKERELDFISLIRFKESLRPCNGSGGYSPSSHRGGVGSVFNKVALG
jgi:hypothetical protein